MLSIERTDTLWKEYYSRKRAFTKFLKTCQDVWRISQITGNVQIVAKSLFDSLNDGIVEGLLEVVGMHC